MSITPRTAGESRAAVIDIGFNSLKMVKYRVQAGRQPTPYGQLGVLLRLGEGLDRTGGIGKKQVSSAIDAIKRCQEEAALDHIGRVLLVGTSPVREAANRKEFLKRVKEETGLDMRLLTGDEEALYGFLGAELAVQVPDMLFFDLGGGSLELAYAERYMVRRIFSLPLGALRLTARYSSGEGLFTRKGRGKMAKFIDRLLPSRRDLAMKKGIVLVGTGGTVRAIARFHQEVTGYPFNKVNNYSMDLLSVDDIARRFLRSRPSELARFDSLGGGRAETVAAGAFVVRSIMKKLKIRRLVASTHGLRDGILAESTGFGGRRLLLEKSGLPGLLARTSSPTEGTAAHDLAALLERAGAIRGRERAVLLEAVDLGRSEELGEMDPDALFWRVMSEDLPLGHEEQLLMAISLVKGRRPRSADWLLKRYGHLLAGGDLERVKRLSWSLRLMEILARSRRPTRVRPARGGGIKVLAEGPGFPRRLAEAAASSLSASIHRPVTVVAPWSGRRGGQRKGGKA